MTVSKAGFEVTVDEVKSLCATAWIPTNIFTTFSYPDDADAECFEISLDALLQCLNIFGNAGAGAAPGGGAGRGRKRWAGDAEDGADKDAAADEDWRVRGRDKRTGMRLTWGGPGFPLSILLWVAISCEGPNPRPQARRRKGPSDKLRAVHPRARGPAQPGVRRRQPRRIPHHEGRWLHVVTCR